MKARRVTGVGRYAKLRIMQSILLVNPSLALFISLRGE